MINDKRVLTCPIPTFLHRRFTDGVYYELCNAVGFSDAFGTSFQRYAGEVLTAANPAGRFNIIEEREYRVGKDRKDSID